MIKTINNSLIFNYISKIRNINLESFLFRKYISEIAKNLAMSAFEKEEMIIKKTPTWMGEQDFLFLDEEKYVFIPILRAALPMLDGVLEMMPSAKAGFLALRRDEDTFESKLFYDRVPNLEGKIAVLLDPMVATGGSLDYAINIIKSKNPLKIISFNIIGSPEGLEFVSSRHRNVDIYIAQIDKELNDKKYILPGIGDAGDRAYNTL